MTVEIFAFESESDQQAFAKDLRYGMSINDVATSVDETAKKPYLVAVKLNKKEEEETHD